MRVVNFGGLKIISHTECARNKLKSLSYDSNSAIEMNEVNIEHGTNGVWQQCRRHVYN